MRLYTLIQVLCLICLNWIFMEDQNLLAQAKKEEGSTKISVDTTPSVKQFQVQIEGKTVKYTTKTGYLSLKNEKGEEEAHIFYVAYTLDGVKDPRTRP